MPFLHGAVPTVGEKDSITTHKKYNSPHSRQPRPVYASPKHPTVPPANHSEGLPSPPRRCSFFPHHAAHKIKISRCKLPAEAARRGTGAVRPPCGSGCKKGQPEIQGNAVVFPPKLTQRRSAPFAAHGERLYRAEARIPFAAAAPARPP